MEQSSAELSPAQRGVEAMKIFAEYAQPGQSMNLGEDGGREVERDVALAVYKAAEVERVDLPIPDEDLASLAPDDDKRMVTRHSPLGFEISVTGAYSKTEDDPVSIVLQKPTDTSEGTPDHGRDFVTYLAEANPVAYDRLVHLDPLNDD